MVCVPSHTAASRDLGDAARRRWPDAVRATYESRRRTWLLECRARVLPDLCAWLADERGYGFAGLVVEETAPEWLLRYLFYGGDRGAGLVHVLARCVKPGRAVPSISTRVHAADWHEREAEDLFGFEFQGHPRLGDFVLHNDVWPEDVGPMRAGFDAAAVRSSREPAPAWQPLRLVDAPGSFLMPVGPIYSGVAESALFLLETIGEDVIRAFPRLFYKYRGIEKIAEGQPVDHALLLAERCAATSAFAHSLAFCQAVEAVAEVEVPARARALRVALAELERLRHHVGAIQEICESTALSVAASQAAILEEDLLRLSGSLTGHRYLFGLNIPGGLARDLADAEVQEAAAAAEVLVAELRRLAEMLRVSSSFVDRLEGIGAVSQARALAHGLVGPVARASGVVRDLRIAQPYSGYDAIELAAAREQAGDGYARLLVLFAEAEESARILARQARALPAGPVCGPSFMVPPGAAFGWAEAPRGATFHWVRIGEAGTITRYRLITPSFVNWHGFHLAAENFAFQDFPIILASFGLSAAECDR
jgi:formate hydrogenlyase subunit 5